MVNIIKEEIEIEESLESRLRVLLVNAFVSSFFVEKGVIKL